MVFLKRIMCIIIFIHILSIHRGRLANARDCNARGHGFAPPRFWYFFIDTVSDKGGLNMVYVTLQDFTVTCHVSGDNL